MNTYQAHPVHTLQEMSRLKTSFPDNIKLYVAREESGKMLGGTVLYISRKVVHTQYISASEEGKRRMHSMPCFRISLKQNIRILIISISEHLMKKEERCSTPASSIRKKVSEEEAWFMIPMNGTYNS